MHRVELKGLFLPFSGQLIESFLMHRVELKDNLGNVVGSGHSKFLMYRVELKVLNNVRRTFHCMPF